MTARIALISVLCLAWILPGLIGHDPWKPDEAYSFGLIYHIIRHGDWLVPTLAGQPFLEKPPLYYLIAAAFAKIFSPPLALHDAARLASGLCMAIVFLFTGLTGRELFGKGYGAAAVLLLVGTFGLLIRSHQMVTELALLAGFAITYYGLALAPRRWAAGGFWLGIGAGISFMSGDLLAPCIIGIIIVLLPVAFRTWRTRRYAAALGIALLAGLPWFVIWPAALYQHSPELSASGCGLTTSTASSASIRSARPSNIFSICASCRGMRGRCGRSRRGRCGARAAPVSCRVSRSRCSVSWSRSSC
jgi:4-amino-4-deoxy-L-arabinose transferase-like glycosyltransferase